MIQQSKNLIYQAANVWNKLTQYQYRLTYGYKKKLYSINLIFFPEDFPHLAGFQYLKDLSLPRYNSKKIISQILNGTITEEQIQKGIQYEEMVIPRLEALIQIKETLDNDFTLFSYNPCVYPFYTQINADYLISAHSDRNSFVFLVHYATDKSSEYDCLCCSAFKQTERNYELNQKSYSLLQKMRIHTETNTTVVLLDKLTKKE